jgi:signal transduction histidine kinase/DNA-binding response OmpR family regulator
VSGARAIPAETVRRAPARPSGLSRLGAAAIAAAASLLVAIMWAGVVAAVRSERAEALTRAEDEVAGQALAFERQLQLQLLAVDQTLRLLQDELQNHPGGVDLRAWRRRAVVLSSVSIQLFVAGPDGVVLASTRPELGGTDVSARDYFRAEAEAPADDGRMFIGGAVKGLVTRRWQMVLARRLSRPDGGFAGVVGVSYDLDGAGGMFEGAQLGADGFAALVGLGDGQVRAGLGPCAEPGVDLAATPMFAAMRDAPDGRWSGPSPDGRERLHAFRQLPDRRLVLVFARDRAEALRGSVAWGRGACYAAALATVGLLVAAAALIRLLGDHRAREALLAGEQARLAVANRALAAERDRADAAASELAATIGGMSDGVTMVDERLRLVQWNDKAAEMAGVPRDLLTVGARIEDILRRQAQAGEFGRVDVEAEVRRRLAQNWAPGQPALLVFERSRPDGRVIEIRRSRLARGGFVTLFSDVTARKQAEVAAREAQATAVAASAAKSRFVAIVSHEIRTPLNTLLNSLRMLGETEMRPDQRRLAGLARQAGDALLALLGDVLEMSRMDAGRLALRPAPFAVRPLLASVADMFRPEAEARGVSLHVSAGADVPDVFTSDAVRVRQVLINLVSNAVKFSRPGPVQLRAGWEPGGGEGAGELLLTVEDQGPPIGADDLAKLFLPFAQLDQRSASGAPGSGLGLSICQRLAALLGGAIGCEPNAAGGNAFRVRLRELRLAGPDAGARATLGRLRLPRTRVLLAEDVAPSQHIMATILRREGHMVDVASDGAAAVEAVARGAYDIVLMDIFMPGLSGLDATRAIRRLPGAASRTPVVALTANASDEDRRGFEAAGLDGAVSKPVDAETLIRTLQRHVWRRRAAGPAAGRPPPPPPPPSPAAAAPLQPVLSEPRLASLRASLPDAVLRPLAESCFSDFSARLPALLAALRDGDAEAARAEAHALAGLAGSYGLARLDQILRAIMDAPQAPGAARAAGSLEAELDAARRALDAALAEAAATA